MTLGKGSLSYSMQQHRLGSPDRSVDLGYAAQKRKRDGVITALERVRSTSSRGSYAATYEGEHARMELAVLRKTLARVRPEGCGGEKGRVRKLELAQRNLVIKRDHCYTGKRE